MHTLSETPTTTPTNIPPTLVPLHPADGQVDYWRRRTREREGQLSEANKALLRLRTLYAELDAKHAELLRRARIAHQSCPAIAKKASLWKRILRVLKK